MLTDVSRPIGALIAAHLAIAAQPPAPRLKSLQATGPLQSAAQDARGNGASTSPPRLRSCPPAARPNLLVFGKPFGGSAAGFGAVADPVAQVLHRHREGAAGGVAPGQAVPP